VVLDAGQLAAIPIVDLAKLLDEKWSGPAALRQSLPLIYENGWLRDDDYEVLDPLGYDELMDSLGGGDDLASQGSTEEIEFNDLASRAESPLTEPQPKKRRTDSGSFSAPSTPNSSATDSKEALKRDSALTATVSGLRDDLKDLVERVAALQLRNDDSFSLLQTEFDRLQSEHKEVVTQLSSLKQRVDRPSSVSTSSSSSTSSPSSTQSSVVVNGNYTSNNTTQPSTSSSSASSSAPSSTGRKKGTWQDNSDEDNKQILVSADEELCKEFSRLSPIDWAALRDFANNKPIDLSSLLRGFTSTAHLKEAKFVVSKTTQRSTLSRREELAVVYRRLAFIFSVVEKNSDLHKSVAAVSRFLEHDSSASQMSDLDLFSIELELRYQGVDAMHTNLKEVVAMQRAGQWNSSIRDVSSPPSSRGCRPLPLSYALSACSPSVST
jgi:hypothetical protein